MRGHTKEFSDKKLSLLVQQIEQAGDVLNILSMACHRDSSGIWHALVEYCPVSDH